VDAVDGDLPAPAGGDRRGGSVRRRDVEEISRDRQRGEVGGKERER